MHNPLSPKPATLIPRRLPQMVLGIGLLASNNSWAIESWALCHRWPTAEFPSSTIPKAQAPTQLTADSSQGKQDQSLVLSGNVVVERPYERLLADEVTYFQTENRVNATGNLRFETPDLRVDGQSGRINLDNDSGEFTETQYYLLSHHGRGESDRILMLNPEVTVLKHASYTTCDPGDEDWVLRASTVTLDQGSGMGSAWNMYLSFQGLPFFYFPYINFPITDERKTGVLPPSIGTSRTNGTDIAIPIYLNIHPQLDATITPHNYTTRGLQWVNEIRYLTHYGKGKIGAEYLDDQTTRTTRTLNHFEHAGAFAPNWTSDINYSRVSDKDYFHDFSSSLSTTSTSQLERHVKVNHSFVAANLMAQAQDYQTVDDTIPYSARPYRRLPQVALTADTSPVDWFRYGVNSEWVRFHEQDHLNGERFDLATYASLPMENAAGFFIPKLTLRHTDYQLEKENNPLPDRSPYRNISTLSLDSGLFFERDMNFFGSSLLQTFEPQLFYLYTPYRDQSLIPVFDSSTVSFSSAQLFQENRFSGRDRVGDTEQVSLSLTSRFLQQDDGFERFRTTVGQIYYLRDRKVSLGGDVLDTTTNTDAILEAEAKLTRNLSLRGDLLWNTAYDTITKRYIKLQHRASNREIVNIAYREQGNRVTAPGSVTKEIDAAALWPLNPRWSLIGRRYHSLPDDRTLEKLFGVEYESCCWAFRAVRRAVYTPDSVTPQNGALRYSWYLQLELKGLTGIGDRIETLMEDTVVGYKAAK
ncbi:MAG: LPS assembly protein LptD [Gammaproteobacteria bacterium]|nr:LPS assembly protein LptD [Gammaproteobacteria bacterium]